VPRHGAVFQLGARDVCHGRDDMAARPILPAR
jgi:hypothetical protein